MWPLEPLPDQCGLGAALQCSKGFKNYDSKGQLGVDLGLSWGYSGITSGVF